MWKKYRLKADVAILVLAALVVYFVFLFGICETWTERSFALVAHVFAIQAGIMARPS